MPSRRPDRAQSPIKPLRTTRNGRSNRTHTAFDATLTTRLRRRPFRDASARGRGRGRGREEKSGSAYGFRRAIRPAAIRLLLESRRHELFDLPHSGQSWFDHAHTQMAEAIALGPLPPSADAREIGDLILSSSFGVHEADKNGFRGVDTDRALRLLWTGLLREFGCDDPETILGAVHAVTVARDSADSRGDRGAPRS